MSNTLDDKVYVDMTANIMRETGAELCDPGISIKVNAARLVDFILSEARRIGELAIGEDIQPKMNGKVIPRGQTVTIDMENNLRESCEFIQENGKYILQQEQRKKLLELTEGATHE